MAFLFVALHILTVRSSLLALYLGIFILLIRWIFIGKKFISGVALLLIMLAIPYAGSKTIPSWQTNWLIWITIKTNF